MSGVKCSLPFGRSEVGLLLAKVKHLPWHKPTEMISCTCSPWAPAKQTVFLYTNLPKCFLWYKRIYWSPSHERNVWPSVRGCILFINDCSCSILKHWILQFISRSFVAESMLGLTQLQQAIWYAYKLTNYNSLICVKTGTIITGKGVFILINKHAVTTKLIFYKARGNLLDFVCI